MTYKIKLTPLFQKNLKRYQSMRMHIRRHVNQVLADPYQDTERLGKQAGGLDLRGCRSVRITRNFRILFVVCEECRRVPECRFCFCEGLPDEAVVFLTVGPHERAYAMREEMGEYAVAQESTEEKYCHSERPEGAKNPVFVLRERDSSSFRSSE
jgi:mRNA-degrading endonuclease RelE of RelBE toxin-antitoxin system